MAGSALVPPGTLFLETLLDAAREPLVILDKDLLVLSVSRAFYEVFRLRPRETIGQSILGLGIDRWEVARLRLLLTEVLPHPSRPNSRPFDLFVGERSVGYSPASGTPGCRVAPGFDLP